MDYYLKIENDAIVKIYNTSYEVREQLIGLVRKDGTYKAVDALPNLTKLTFAKDRQSVANSKHNYVLDGDTWRLKTDEELNTEKIPSKRQSANTLHDKLEKEFIVEAHGRKYNFNQMAVSKFGIKLLSSAPDATINWTAYDNITYEHTVEEAKAIFQAGEDYLYDIHQAKLLDKAACDNLDFSLTNLKAIEEQQKLLGE